MARKAASKRKTNKRVSYAEQGKQYTKPTEKQREQLWRRLTNDATALNTIAPVLGNNLTDDPLIQYTRHVAETFGLGYVPPELGGATVAERWAYLVDQLRDTVAHFFGPNWRIYLNHVGMPSGAARMLAQDTPYKAGSASVHRLRLMQMIMLVHISQIREQLADQERKLWIQIQQTHDPVFTGEDARYSSFAHIQRGRQYIRDALGKLMYKVPKPYYLPLRALGLIQYPSIDSRAAMILAKHDMESRGEISRAWQHSPFRDGITDINEYTYSDRFRMLPDEYQKPRKTGQAPWMHYLREARLKQRGEPMPLSRDDWDADDWAMYFAFKERATMAGRKLRTKNGKPPFPSEVEPTQREIEAAMQAMRARREKDTLDFLKYLDRANGLSEGTAREMLEDHLDTHYGEQVADAVPDRAPYVDDKTRKIAERLMAEEGLNAKMRRLQRESITSDRSVPVGEAQLNRHKLRKFVREQKSSWMDYDNGGPEPDEG